MPAGRSVRNAPQHETRIMPPEAEAVSERIFQRRGTGFAAEIEICDGRVQIPGQMQLLVAQAERGANHQGNRRNQKRPIVFKQLGVGGVKDLTAEQLTPILTYHVVSGKVMSTDLTNTSVATLNGQKVKIDLSNGVHINESKVVKADISGNNGVVHVIDRVLLPK